MVPNLGVKQSKPARRVRETGPPGNFELRSSEITGNVYFSIHFWIFKVFKEGNQITRKGALCPSL